MTTAAELIEYLQLQPHPEGGFYREVYRATGTITKSCLPSTFDGDRNFSTSIYYLLQQGDFSAFHRIKSDEIWHFYAGGGLHLHLLSETNGYECWKLGSHLQTGDAFQLVIPASVWFAAEPAPRTAFTLTGCTVSPGFDFLDFEMASKKDLVSQFQQHTDLINRLCR